LPAVKPSLHLHIWTNIIIILRGLQIKVLLHEVIILSRGPLAWPATPAVRRRALTASSWIHAALLRVPASTRAMIERCAQLGLSVCCEGSDRLVWVFPLCHSPR
jgi:hypothetical protein